MQPAPPPRSADDAPDDAPRLRDHWSAHPWRSPSRLAWFILPGGDTVAAAALRLRRDLRGVEMDVVAPEDLHITLVTLGDEGTLDASTQRRMLDAVRDAIAGTPRASVDLDGAIVVEEGIWAHIGNVEGLRRLRSAVADACDQAAVPGVQVAGDDPHLALAYSHGRPATSDVEALLAPTPLRAVLSVLDVALVRLERTPGAYRVTPLLRLPLRELEL